MRKTEKSTSCKNIQVDSHANRISKNSKKTVILITMATYDFSTRPSRFQVKSYDDFVLGYFIEDKKLCVIKSTMVMEKEPLIQYKAAYESNSQTDEKRKTCMVKFPSGKKKFLECVAEIIHTSGN